MRQNLRWLLLATLGLLLPGRAPAQSGLKGELDLESDYAGSSGDSLAAALDERYRWDQGLRLRLMWSGALDSGWGLDLAYLAEARHGGGVELERKQHALAPELYVDPRKTSLLRLEATLSDHGQDQGAQGLDRLAVSYSSAHWVFRAGRQALTWGSGLVFHPMDLFNPFPPNATYTTYKPGTDMLYGQWLLDSGADIQGVLVPRRHPGSGRIAADQSSAGLKWHDFAGAEGQLGIDLLLARDYRAEVLGIGVSAALGAATWSAELLPTRLDGGGLPTSLLANVQYAWSWGGKDLNGYAELFRNGLGVSGSGHTLTELPGPLLQRLARGELFTVAKDYLAMGVDLQWTPLLTLKPLVIDSLDDGSRLLIGQAVYSLSQNTSLTAGLQRSLGHHGSEFGGLETARGSGVFDAPAEWLYARLTWYF